MFISIVIFRSCGSRGFFGKFFQFFFGALTFSNLVLFLSCGGTAVVLSYPVMILGSFTVSPPQAIFCVSEFYQRTLKLTCGYIAHLLISFFLFSCTSS